MSDKIKVLFQGDSITDVGRNRESQNNPNDHWGGLGHGYPLMTAAAMLEKYP